MKTSTVFEYLLSHLLPLFEQREAEHQARLLADHLVELQTTDWKSFADQSIERLSQGEPLQYVMEYTWFYHLKFRVNPHVLIPRPETEELVDWVVGDFRKGKLQHTPAILDVGTGSGCIAIALKKQIPEASVEAIDVSQSALEVALQNAQENNVHVDFRELDILSDIPDRSFDLVISNPPYVGREEAGYLSANIMLYEPHLALIPSGEDPLIFYRRLLHLGKQRLHANGYIYLEINEFHADEIRNIFSRAGFETELRKDMQGKWRMLKAWMNG